MFGEFRSGESGGMSTLTRRNQDGCRGFSSGTTSFSTTWLVAAPAIVSAKKTVGMPRWCIRIRVDRSFGATVHLLTTVFFIVGPYLGRRFVATAYSRLLFMPGT